MKVGLTRILYLFLGFVFVGLAAFGAVLPILPTTPFLILALACFAKSSEKLHKWLYYNRLFGHPLQKWDKHRVIPPVAKIVALTSMVGSLAYIILFLDTPIFLVIFAALLIVYGAWFVLSKPSYIQQDKMKKIIVVAAIIINKNKVLCVKRAYSKYKYISNKFEFPGGKVEESETETEALKRELQEELSLNIKVGEKFLTVDHEYPDFSIKLITYLCECESRDIVLHEHVDFKWLDNTNLKQLDWAAADIPIIEKLIDYKL
ncbi:MAG: DUF454 family protein [Magnetococcales bacterium]|nr:DUF454 family protein [Magnetococcales bacterium]